MLSYNINVHNCELQNDQYQFKGYLLFISAQEERGQDWLPITNPSRGRKLLMIEEIKVNSMEKT